MIELPLDSRSRIPLYRQIARHLRRMIREGALASGERLPAGREFAAFLGVSRTTVVQAYALLEEEGLIEQRGRSGAYVLSRPEDPLRLPAVAAGRRPEYDLESPFPDPSLLPRDRLVRALRDLASEEEEIALPTPLEGLASLRAALVHHAAARGIPARPEGLIVVSGGQEGLSALFAACRETGIRRLFAESLSYPEAIASARLEGLTVEGLPLEEEPLVRGLSRLGPEDLLYLIPSFHNPTGRTLSAEARRRILEARARRGFRILEDDTYGELRTGGISVPALRASDEEGAVCYLGSFSQTLFPGVRLSYLLPPADLAEPLLRVRRIRSGPSSALAQRLALAFLSRGGLAGALDAGRPAIGARLARACRALEEAFPGRLHERPSGGIYLWLRTDPLTGAEARERALARGVAVADGSAFDVEGRTLRAVRISLSGTPEGRIEEAVGRLAQAWPECGVSR